VRVPHVMLFLTKMGVLVSGASKHFMVLVHKHDNFSQAICPYDVCFY